MPRAARKKDPSAIYHAMSRSITEFDLFPTDDDKEYFLDLLQKYKEKYNYKVYGYCLMTNHYHLHIDSNGYDISKVMKSINQSYVKYINKKYNRRGHLLGERFNSKIIETDEYNLTVSAYLHNNPKDLPEYAGKEFEYPYSSMGIYLEKRKDKRGLIETDFVLSCINEADKAKALEAYVQMVAEKRETGLNIKLKKYLEEFKQEQNEYIPGRQILLRDKNPEEVIKAIAQKFRIKEVGEINHRWKRRTMEFRELVAYALTNYCGMGNKEACRYLHNMTSSGLASLRDRGFEKMRRDDTTKKFLMSLCV